MGKGLNVNDPNEHNQESEDQKSKHWWYLLLLLPFIGLMYPPLYAFDAPRFIGIPFFYWYQMLWLFLTAGLTTIVFRATR